MPSRMKPWQLSVCGQTASVREQRGWEPQHMNKSSHQPNQQADVLSKYADDKYLHVAKNLLQAKEQSEEAYLGAKAILMLNGLI